MRVTGSEQVQEFVEQASDMQSRVIASQLANGLTFEVPLDPSFAGLVEAWALGQSERVLRPWLTPPASSPHSPTQGPRGTRCWR
eukprot:745695-Hanusia_phi.AAC.1